MTIWMRIVLAAAIVTTLAVGYTALTRHHYQRGYDAAFAAVNKARLEQIAAAQEETDKWKQAAQEAEHAHAKLQTEINRLVTVNADLRAGVARLRGDLDRARAGRMSQLTEQTCPDTAATLSDVLRECGERVERLAGRYAALAAAADRHAADAQRLIDAWPE
jgi:hypothetical protein